MSVRLRDLNLNALVALDVLLQERHVSRAARRLGVTQSGLSHTLRQLRERFDDPLLVRGRGGLLPTPRAEQLARALRRGMDEIERGLADPAYDPAHSQREFSLAAPDHLMLPIAPRLSRMMRQQAPVSRLLFRPAAVTDIAGQLESGRLDLVLTVAPPDEPGLRRKRLRSEGFSCVVRQGHPRINKRLTLKLYCEVPHLVPSPPSSGDNPIDALLRERGLSREVALRVPSALAAPALVADTDYILTSPTSLARHFATSFALRLFKPPLPLSELDVYMLWHERLEQDPAHRWLRQRVQEASGAG